MTLMVWILTRQAIVTFLKYQDRSVVMKNLQILLPPFIMKETMVLSKKIIKLIHFVNNKKGAATSA